jgi:hypothetical protein
MKDNIGLRAGVLDDQTLLDKPPAIEVYVEKRPPVSNLYYHYFLLCCGLGLVNPMSSRYP